MEYPWKETKFLILVHSSHVILNMQFSSPRSNQISAHDNINIISTTRKKMYSAKAHGIVPSMKNYMYIQAFL